MDLDAHAAIVVIAEMLSNVERRIRNLELQIVHEAYASGEADGAHAEFLEAVKRLYAVMEADD